MMVLSWFELPDKDRPDEEIWLDEEALSAHFEKLNRDSGSSSGSDWESVPDAGEEIRNDFTRDLFGGRK